jgi:UDP-glucose 4-epimerase
MKNLIVVTGGSGMIGSNLVNTLKILGFKVYNLDNLSSGFFNGIHDDGYIYCDVSNKEKTFEVLNKIKPSTIFHCAAHFANQNSVDFPYSDINDNIIGLLNILEYSKSNGSRVVYASSSCIYGNGEKGTSVESSAVPFDTPYAINKYSGELYCKFYNHLYGVKVNILRIFNTYGPGEMPGKYRNVIPNFFQKAARNEDIIITGDGNELRDFTYVDDTVDLIIKLYQSNYWSADVFNGGTGRHCKIIDLANNILAVTKSKSKIIYTKRRVWDGVKTRVSDISKSKNLLNYNPNISLASGLKVTWEWLRGRI